MSPLYIIVVSVIVVTVASEPVRVTEGQLYFIVASVIAVALVALVMIGRRLGALVEAKAQQRREEEKRAAEKQQEEEFARRREDEARQRRIVVALSPIEREIKEQSRFLLNPRRAEQAFRLLVGTMDAPAFKATTVLLNDPNVLVRLAAACALGINKDPAAIAALLEQYQGSKPDYLPYGGGDPDAAYSPEDLLGFESLIRNVALIRCGHQATIDRLVAFPLYGEKEPFWEYQKRCRELPDVGDIIELFGERVLDAASAVALCLRVLPVLGGMRLSICSNREAIAFLSRVNPSWAESEDAKVQRSR